jgi:glycosyltransferase involved in cell wall biosynthesis
MIEPKRDSSPSLSFVVPAHNEELLLPETLSAIHAAARACRIRYEIVVADDASTDRTAVIAANGGAHVVAVSCRQIAATRNAGARAARGEYLVFVDADTRITEGVLRATVAVLLAGAAGGGAAMSFDEPVPPYSRLLLRALVWMFRVSRLAAGCYLFCTRRAFDAAGGFDERLFGSEEIALSRALKRQGRFVVLTEAVETSGRKLRTYSGGEILRITAGLALSGLPGLRRRDKLDFWYGPRRPDPKTDANPLCAPPPSRHAHGPPADCREDF